MPKIIQDVEKIIRDNALILFIEFSYTDVDMKMISQKSGIAVGTLYNYYKSKKQLYISIIKESWQKTFDKLDSISEFVISPESRIRKFISTLYEDIEARKGLGRALINISVDELKEDIEINDLKNELISKVEKFLSSLDKTDRLSKWSNINTRLAESLLVSTLAMLEVHPNEKEENINFLVEFISLAIK